MIRVRAPLRHVARGHRHWLSLPVVIFKAVRLHGSPVLLLHGTRNGRVVFRREKSVCRFQEGSQASLQVVGFVEHMSQTIARLAAVRRAGSFHAAAAAAEPDGRRAYSLVRFVDRRILREHSVLDRSRGRGGAGGARRNSARVRGQPSVCTGRSPCTGSGARHRIAARGAGAPQCAARPRMHACAHIQAAGMLYPCARADTPTHYSGGPEGSAGARQEATQIAGESARTAAWRSACPPRPRRLTFHTSLAHRAAGPPPPPRCRCAKCVAHCGRVDCSAQLGSAV